MLTTKRINLGISILSKVLRVFIILYSASILANCVWWILSPGSSDIFVQKSYLDIRDKASRYIDNRSPFGIVVVKVKVQEKPRITDQLKLTGVYLNTDKDSVAFLEYQGKPMISHSGAKIGDSDATLKSISASNIIVTSDDQDVTIQITPGGGAKASNNQSSSRNSPDTMFGGRSSNSGSSSNQNIDEFRQQRKRAIEGYNSRGNTSTTRGNSSSSDDDQH